MVRRYPLHETVATSADEDTSFVNKGVPKFHFSKLIILQVLETNVLEMNTLEMNALSTGDKCVECWQMNTFSPGDEQVENAHS